MVLVTLATTRPREAKDIVPRAIRRKAEKNKACEEQLEDDCRQGEDKIGDDAGGQHVAGCDGGDVKAAQDALFAKGDESSAETPEAAHHGQGYDRPEKISNHQGDAPCEDSGIKEEKTERHDHAEK